mmetsp:Transcript_27570/g.47591  ORF Transcript_27570/g.47591 Transcript_27570/m.47591 type:complete len:115 (+) Transcript_27570:501-845(+)
MCFRFSCISLATGDLIQASADMPSDEAAPVTMHTLSATYASVSTSYMQDMLMSSIDPDGTQAAGYSSGTSTIDATFDNLSAFIVEMQNSGLISNVVLRLFTLQSNIDLSQASIN